MIDVIERVMKNDKRGKRRGKHIGEQSIEFDDPVYIIASSSVVGTKESEGPLKDLFDVTYWDSIINEDSWEKEESSYVQKGLDLAVKKSGRSMEQMDYIISGDLLNQITGTTFGIREFNRPHLGIFAACSTIGEGLGLASCLIDGDFATNILIGASSHFCGAEKQFRFPLELGNQRPPTSTWTVTGEGAFVLSKLANTTEHEKHGGIQIDNNGEITPKIKGITTGKIVDMGITDANNMGAAMAPAAISTILQHFRDFGVSERDFDVIATGDLGDIGSKLVKKIMSEEYGYDLSENYTDCGLLIYDNETQDTHSGGSGCACSAVTLAAYFYPKLKSGEIKDMLFVPTGALMNTTSSLQGESIPAIAHAVHIGI